MLEYTKDYLVNMLFVLLPILLAQSILTKEDCAFESRKQKIYLSIIFSVTSILCMTFPFLLPGNTILDLRLVPFVIAMLYGGARVGIVVMFVSLTYRFFLGGIGFYVSLAEYIIIFALLMLLLKKYRKFPLHKKSIIITLVTVLPTLFFMPVFYYYIGDMYVFNVGLQLVLISIISIVLSIYLMESTIEKVHMMIQFHKFEKETIVSHLAASVSHEVRNPLTVTKGFLQLLREKNKVSEDKEYFDLALKELQNAESIISDFLTFAKPSMEVKTPLNLAEELKNSITVINAYAQLHNVGITLRGLPAPIKGDKEKIHQLFINIFKNCIEAMPNGGDIFVEIVNKKKDVEVTIKDTGVGMTKSQLLRLGEPFFSTKENGTGLGMMVAFSIIKSMGGTYKVWSKENEGTTFYITIPINEQ